MRLKKAAGNRKGFTLIELVIVIVIIGILSVVAVPIYRNYIRKAMMTEGIGIMKKLIEAEQIYASRRNVFIDQARASTFAGNDPDLSEFNISQSKYFNQFSVTGQAGSIAARTATCTMAVYGKAAEDSENITVHGIISNNNVVRITVDDAGTRSAIVGDIIQ